MFTTSATHRFPPTVLQEICRELLCLPLDQTDQGFRHIGSRTVAALAVTARLFLEPALNVLWHTIPDIAILFFTLDDEAYYQGSVIEGERQFASRFLRKFLFILANLPARDSDSKAPRGSHSSSDFSRTLGESARSTLLRMSRLAQGTSTLAQQHTTRWRGSWVAPARSCPTWRRSTTSVRSPCL